MKIRTTRGGLTAVGVLVSLAVFITTELLSTPANAASGGYVGTVTFSQDCSSGNGHGIAFDGTNLWYSCYRSQTDLYKANPTTGAVIASFDVAGGLGALAWDSGRGKLWAGAACGTGQSGSEVYLIDPSSGAATLQFNVPAFSGNCIDDGLAYDGVNDTIYFSSDGETVVRHLSTSGLPMPDDGFVWGGSGAGCYNSGLAVGGQLLYEGSNGCSHVWVVNKVSKAPSFDFSTVVGGDPNFRDEDLECDTSTFLGQGKHVMWSKEAFSPMRANAFEVPFGSCGVGGQDATATPPPSATPPQYSPTPTATPGPPVLGGVAQYPGASSEAAPWLIVAVLVIVAGSALGAGSLVRGYVRKRLRD